MISKIFLIESIPNDEIQTGEELYDDIIKPYNNYLNFQANVYPLKKISTKKEFLREIHFVLSNVDSSDNIILHIEAHGHKNKKSLVLSNHDSISWAELTEHLIPINRKVKNKLHLFVVSCFGSHISQEIDLKKTAPYRSFLASSKVVKPREIIDYYTLLYDELFRSKDLYKAVHKVAKIDKYNKFHMKDIDFTLTAITYGHLELFFNSGSFTTIKHMFDHMLNIDIDFSEMQNHDDPKIYIIDLFRRRFCYLEN